jgi:DNA-binding HxlR family transcriptional regulator
VTQTHYPQFCALARAAEIVGERWTLLIVRELLLGPKRFSDLVERLSGVSPTVLTGRLNALIESGVVRRAALPAPFNAQTYELTPVGLALKPAIRELIRWGGHFLFPPRPDDTFEPDSVLLGLDAITRQTPTPARTIALRVTQGGKSASFLVQVALMARRSAAATARPTRRSRPALTRCCAFSRPSCRSSRRCRKSWRA